MKTVLFFPKEDYSFRSSCPPLGLMSIATYLNCNGHTAVVCDRFFEKKSVEQILDEQKPKVIGVSIMYPSFLKDAINISKVARNRNITVVWGGSFATTIDEIVLRSGVVDFVSLNEGELTWLEIADKVDENKSIYDIKQGISYILKGKYVRTSVREFIDLTELPELDWSLIDPKNYFKKTYGYNHMITMYYSKGCTGKCSYCYNPGFHHSKRRCRKIETVISEMKKLVYEYGVRGFDFTDDVMFSNRKEAIEFCDAIKKSNLNICWSGYLAAGVLNSVEDFKMLYDSGCRSLIFGVESGSEKVLKSVNKYVRVNKIKSNVDFCNEVGIVPITMFILGFPDENEEDIKDTLNLARSLKGASVGYNFYTPVPGSKLYSELLESKKLSSIANLDDFAEMDGFEHLFENFTKVSTKELHVIKNYIRLRGILTPTSNSNREQIIKVILSVAESWLGRGFIHFVKSFTYTAYSFIGLLSVFLHPKIRKKYELYFIE